MEAVELPPVGMSWARAGLPALGPPPLKKGRSRQELMQREAEFQRRRGADEKLVDMVIESDAAWRKSEHTLQKLPKHSKVYSTMRRRRRSQVRCSVLHVSRSLHFTTI